MTYVPVIAVIWLIDRLSKLWVVRNMVLGESRPMLGDWFHLTYVHNTGAAFSLLRDRTGLLTIISIVLLASLLFLRKELASFGRVSQIAIALLLGGAFGNLYDRLVFGYVIDFLDVNFWAVFNIADSAIVIGVFLFLWTVWQEERGGRGSVSQ